MPGTPVSARPGPPPGRPVPGSPCGPPSRAPRGPRPGPPRGPPPGHTPKVKNVFCFKLDAKSVPEALATTIRILLMFSTNTFQNIEENRHPEKLHFFGTRTCPNLDAMSAPEALT